MFQPGFGQGNRRNFGKSKAPGQFVSYFHPVATETVMKRPVMDSMSVVLGEDSGPSAPRRRAGAVREQLRRVARAARWVAQFLFAKPVFYARRRDPDHEQPI